MHSCVSMDVCCLERRPVIFQKQLDGAIMSSDSGEIAASVPLLCIALEVNIRDYVEIITSWHKGHTSLVID